MTLIADKKMQPYIKKDDNLSSFLIYVFETV